MPDTPTAAHPAEEATTIFLAHRKLLFSVVYAMLAASPTPRTSSRRPGSPGPLAIDTASARSAGSAASSLALPAGAPSIIGSGSHGPG
ncbi:hypothetical protein [Sphaerisporangium fuscum]|uniref:hypothetical protein n=1 Tax=Sphaerisporangium fuscum TaxID=2835868 RepID=UPI001BDC692A|nr:hypothetical protein [Sphaerisporangium fuscum]